MFWIIRILFLGVRKSFSIIAWLSYSQYYNQQIPSLDCRPFNYCRPVKYTLMMLKLCNSYRKRSAFDNIITVYISAVYIHHEGVIGPHKLNQNQANKSWLWICLSPLTTVLIWLINIEYSIAYVCVTFHVCL